MEKEKKGLNIALFVDAYFPYIDGVVMVVDNYAKHLGKVNKVYVFCPKPRDKNYEYNKPYEIINCKSIVFPLVGTDYARPKKDKEFQAKLDELDIDIVHIHSPMAMGAFALKYAKSKNIPVISTFHSQFKKDLRKYLKVGFLVNPVLKNFMKVFNGSNETWTFNSGCRNTLLEYGYTAGKCHLVSNGTDMVPLPDIADHVKAVNEEYGLTDVKNVFIFVGRLWKAKNNVFNMEALNELKKRGFNDFKFVIVGEGEDYKTLKKLTEKYGLQDNIIMTGIIRDRAKLAGLLARSDLFLFPSLYDMSSLVQIEAACYKTPVIFLEGANTASAVTHEVNGFISPNDLQTFANMIESAIADKEKLKKIGEQAHKDLYITWEQLAQKVHERYLHVIEEHKKNSQDKASTD